MEMEVEKHSTRLFSYFLLTVKHFADIMLTTGMALIKCMFRERLIVNNPIRRTRPEKTGVRAPLGDLEMAVMRHIWDCGTEGCQGADVQQALDKERPVALTTILTTLDRLRDKGIIRRERQGKAFRYWHILSEEQLQERIVTGVMDRLIAQFPKAVATYFTQQGPTGEETGSASLTDLARQVEIINERQPEENRPQDALETETIDGN